MSVIRQGYMGVLAVPAVADPQSGAVVHSWRRPRRIRHAYQPSAPARVRRSSDCSGLREWSGCCWSVEFDADDGVQLDRVRRDPVLAVGKIEKTEPSHGHRF